MINAMDVVVTRAEPGLDRRLRRVGYRPVLAVLLLPSLLLIGVLSYYPAVRSLIGGSILITLVSQFTAAEIVTHLPRRPAAIAKYLLVLPIVLPPLVLIEVWAYLLQPGSGLVDKVSGVFGLPQPAWYADPRLALIGILLAGFPWISNLGFLIFLGGLQNLPRDVLDAGRLDGLTPLKRVFAIDIPLLMPQFRIVVILSGINAVQNFIPILHGLAVHPAASRQLAEDQRRRLVHPDRAGGPGGQPPRPVQPGPRQQATQNHVDLGKY